MRLTDIMRGALCDRPCRDVVGWLLVGWSRSRIVVKGVLYLGFRHISTASCSSYVTGFFARESFLFEFSNSMCLYLKDDGTSTDVYVNMMHEH